MNATTEVMATGHAGRVQYVIGEIQRQKESKRDYVYPSSKLSVTEGRLAFAASQTFQVGDRVYTEWKDAEAVADATGEQIKPLGMTGSLPLNRTAERQLAAKLGIPLMYIDSLRSEKNSDLADHNFSTLLERLGKRVLVRTLDGNVRAILSDYYRILDNADVFFAAADTLTNPDVGASIWNARMWDDGFEMLAVSSKITGDVLRDPNYMGSQSHVWHSTGGGNGKGGGGTVLDPHNAMVKITNSETGCGGMNVQFGLFRQACNNIMVVGTGIQKVHLGKKNGQDGLVYAEDTQEAESKAIWLKLRDAIRTAFDANKFADMIARLNGAAEQVLGNPEKAVENVIKEFKLPEERKATILKNLFMGCDMTKFGLIQAVTGTAHESDEAERGEEASQYEAIGGKILDMSDSALELVGA